jgi:hypothetical protein
MRKRSAATITTFVVASVLATLVATSSAAKFTLIGDTFSKRWATVTFEAAGSSVRCPVTLAGTFTDDHGPDERRQMLHRHKVHGDDARQRGE